MKTRGGGLRAQLFRVPVFVKHQVSVPECRSCSHVEVAGGAAGEPSRQDLGAAALEYLELARAHPPPASVLRSHMMWLLGRNGKSRHASFRHLGPFSAQQLWCALVEAETPDEHEGIVRATLLA